MKIRLIKETKLSGNATYYVTLDDELQPGTVCASVAEAMEAYEDTKLQLLGKRTEILIQEEI